jgi:hypothetical protein
LSELGASSTQQLACPSAGLQARSASLMDIDVEGPTSN